MKTVPVYIEWPEIGTQALVNIEQSPLYEIIATFARELADQLGVRVEVSIMSYRITQYPLQVRLD